MTLSTDQIVGATLFFCAAVVTGLLAVYYVPNPHYANEVFWLTWNAVGCIVGAVALLLVPHASADHTS